MISWKEQDKIIRDVKQMFLNPDLSITKNNFSFAVKQSDIKYDSVVLCPFCLMSYELDKFVLRKGLRVCPNCSSKLKLSTLTNIDDLDKFVEFVFNYRFNGFWDKICLDVLKKDENTRFNEWCKRLWQLGLSLKFWEKYKAIRGDYEENE